MTPGAPPPPLTLRLLIHKSQAGAIIGKQGSVIRQIKEVRLPCAMDGIVSLEKFFFLIDPSCNLSTQRRTAMSICA